MLFEEKLFSVCFSFKGESTKLTNLNNCKVSTQHKRVNLTRTTTWKSCVVESVGQDGENATLPLSKYGEGCRFASLCDNLAGTNNDTRHVAWRNAARCKQTFFLSPQRTRLLHPPPRSPPPFSVISISTRGRGSLSAPSHTQSRGDVACN